MLPILGTSWYQRLSDYFHANPQLGVTCHHRKHYWEFISTKCPQRTITLRRLRRSYQNGYQPDPRQPPVIWALWSEWLSPPLMGYFEEHNLFPTTEEVSFTLDIFKLWIVQGEGTCVLWNRLKNRSNFFEKLPPERCVKDSVKKELRKKMKETRPSTGISDLWRDLD